MHLKSVLMIVFLALTAFIGWQAWTYLNDALTILSDGAGARPPGTQEALALIRDAGLAILALIVLIAVGAGGVIFFFRHLSKDLVATETVLRDSDFRFRDTIENINEAFALFDVQDRLVMCNYRFLETYKSLPPREDMIGKKFEDLMRIVLDAGEIADALALSDPEKWLDQRIERHLHPPTASIEVALT
ncbi:MAG: PAS-domain containing protein, partial [Rhodospirillales bacterium]|nr:PAS-domain containing protein [Rhodospirillales bacterium]